MKVLFLDIDGVLNDSEKCPNGHCAIDGKCVHRLNRVLRAIADLKLVISSDWREWVHRHEMTMEGLEKLLLTHGIDCENRVAGVTRPDKGTPHYPPTGLDDNRYREVQILEWIQEHHPKQFAVLDDFRLPELSARHVRTNRHRGLTDDDAARVIGLLG